MSTRTHAEEVRRAALMHAIGSKTAPIIRSRNLAAGATLDPDKTLQQVTELLTYVDVAMPEGTTAGNLNAVLDEILKTLRNVDGTPEPPPSSPMAEAAKSLSRRPPGGFRTEAEYEAAMRKKGLTPVNIQPW